MLISAFIASYYFWPHNRYYRCCMNFLSHDQARTSFILVGYLVSSMCPDIRFWYTNHVCFPLSGGSSGYCYGTFRFYLVSSFSIWTLTKCICKVQIRKLTLGHSYLCYFVHTCLLITSSLLTACHIVAYESFHYVWIHSPGVHWWTAVNRVRLIYAIFIITCATTRDSEV